MRRALWVTLIVVSLLLITATAAYAITNGQPDAGRHPYVGLLIFDSNEGDCGGGPCWRCSGTLLTPSIVLTAGHCTEGAVRARIWMDEGPIPSYLANPPGEYPFGGATSFEGVPHTFPGFCIGCGNGLPGFAYRDTGIVVLTEPVPESVVDEYGVLPSAGYVDSLKSKTPVDLVGYGVQEQLTGGGPPVWTGLRWRLYAPSELVSGKFVHSDGFMRIALNPGGGSGGTCFGDSGGPILTREGKTVLAVNSYVTNSNCSGVGYSARVDIPEVLTWINGFLQP